MKSATPKVSIGLPVCKGEKYLALALDPVLKQGLRRLRVDHLRHASTDGTAEICKAYAARDPRIQYYRNEVNIGSAPNYEKVFAWLAANSSSRTRMTTCYPPVS